MMISKDERNWAIVAHLSSFLGYFAGGLGGLIGPLIVWLIKKDDAPFVAEQAKESLNFQISLLIYAVGLVMSIFFLIGLLFVWFAVPFLAVIGLVLPIVGAVRANEGKSYRYPFTIRFIQ
jgi:uncharacterized Tic20 family protein